jgi:hypothetical protein
VAFLQNLNGKITPMLKALGETWTHTGIMVDGNNCRSDLMEEFSTVPATTSALASFVGQNTCSVGPPGSPPAVGDVKLDPANLYQGSPGVITQAMYDSPYFYPYGVKLAQPVWQFVDTSTGTTFYPRLTMRAAADTANGISQRYGIYGYTDWTYAANEPGTSELSPKGVPNGHEGCSGFVTRALYNTSKTLPNFDLNIYSAAQRTNAVNAMYSSLYGTCSKEYGGGVSDKVYQGLLAMKCNTEYIWQCPKGTLTDCQINKLQNSCNGVGTGVAEYTKGLLNQVLNCFAFGGFAGSEMCEATTSTAWQSPGTGSGTISPQSVYNQMGTKYSATYQQEDLYPTVWSTKSTYGCVDLPNSNPD